ncbi:hypothetical protein FHW17_002030 [Phyllobacterium sp. P30BS-XVII]|nr:hypothetical protein [Phyllobacterium sp. P30BS-XVII]
MDRFILQRKTGCSWGGCPAFILMHPSLRYAKALTLHIEARTLRILRRVPSVILGLDPRTHR